MPSRPPAPPFLAAPSRRWVRAAFRIGLVALLAALAGSAWAKKTPLAISPASATAAAGGKVTFKASGGAGGYTYALTENGSGGSVQASTGEYTAGAQAGADEVTVTDAEGQTQAASIKVQALSTAPGEGTTDLGGHR